MWSRIEVEAMIIVPYDGLNTQRERTKVALMSYSCNKLQVHNLLFLQLFENQGIGKNIQTR